MHKAFKISAHIFFLLVLSSLVFLGGLIERISSTFGKSDSESDKDVARNPSAVPYAFADATPPPPSDGGGYQGGDGCGDTGDGGGGGGSGDSGDSC
jgi:hypothetical protein